MLLPSLFVAFLLGLIPVVHKYVLMTVDPNVVMVVGGTAYFLVLMAFAAYHWRAMYPQITAMDAKHWLFITLAAVAMNFVARLLYLYILKDNDSYIVSALIYSSPLFTLIIAIMFLHERITLLKAAGVLCICIGIMLLAMSGIR